MIRGGSWFHKYKDRDSNTETDIDISQLLNKNTSDIRVDITNMWVFGTHRQYKTWSNSKV